MWSVIRWRSRALWKSIPAAQLSQVYKKFVAEYGGVTELAAYPSSYGLDVRLDLEPPVSASNQGVVVIHRWAIHPNDIDAFVVARNATVASFFVTQPGCIRSMVLYDPTSVATVWTHEVWATRADRNAASSSAALAQQRMAFQHRLGYEPSSTSVPGANGLDVVLTAGANHTSNNW